MTTNYDYLAATLMTQGTATEADLKALAVRALEALGVQCPNCEEEDCESNEDGSWHLCRVCQNMWGVES